MSELNQYWRVTNHKRNRNEIDQLVTGFTRIIQSFIFSKLGKQDRFTLITIVPIKRIITGFDQFVSQI
jgi:hypothetical protein